MLATCVDNFQQSRIARQAVVSDGLADTAKVLINDATGTDVHVADLGVAHLPIRQAYKFTGSLYVGMTANGVQVVPGRRIGAADGVVLGVLAATPAVKNH